MNEKYKIIDNFLDPGYYNLIESVFLGNEAGVKWHYQDDMSGHDTIVVTRHIILIMPRFGILSYIASYDRKNKIYVRE